jgi:hypothetical protein
MAAVRRSGGGVGCGIADKPVSAAVGAMYCDVSEMLSRKHEPRTHVVSSWHPPKGSRARARFRSWPDHSPPERESEVCPWALPIQATKTSLDSEPCGTTCEGRIEPGEGGGQECLSWVQVVAARAGGPEVGLRAQCRRPFLRLAAFLCASSTGPGAGLPALVYRISLAAQRWSETRGSTCVSVAHDPSRGALHASALLLPCCACAFAARTLLHSSCGCGMRSADGAELLRGELIRRPLDHTTPIVRKYGRSHSTDGEEGGGRVGRR